MSWWLLLRWSGRDLRRKWVQVAAIALVIAIGTGLFSALGSTSVWRRTSNDDSFAMTGMYDIRVRASEGAFADEGSLVALLAALPDPSVVAIAEERLVVATQVDASTPQRTILVPGRIVGLDVAGVDVAYVDDFERQAEDYRYALVQHLNQLHADEVAHADDRYVAASGSDAPTRKRIEADHWRESPQFDYRPPPLAASVGHAGTACLVLAAWAAGVSLVLWRLRPEVSA